MTYSQEHKNRIINSQADCEIEISSIWDISYFFIGFISSECALEERNVQKKNANIPSLLQMNFLNKTNNYYCDFVPHLFITFMIGNIRFYVFCFPSPQYLNHSLPMTDALSALSFNIF